MNRYSRREKEKVSQFRQIVMGASEKQAVDCLRAAGWSVEGAIEVFYSSGMAVAAGATPGVDTLAIDALFLKYKGSNPRGLLGNGGAWWRLSAREQASDSIEADGIAALCQDLEVDPSDIVMLVLSWHMGAAVMCEYSREEWVRGLTSLRCDSLDKLRRKLPELRGELRDPDKWRAIYNYAYSFSCEKLYKSTRYTSSLPFVDAVQKGQKCVQLDTAVAMWQLLFSEERRWQYVDDWCHFLQQHHNRAISKDTWVQLFEFMKTVDHQFSNYDENAAWPYLIDEFVDAMRAKLAKAGV